MAGISLLTPSQKLAFTNIADRHMPSFWEIITVYKEPKAIVANPASLSVYPGYKETSIENEVTYEPVYQSFSGLVIKMANKLPNELYQINNRVWKGDVKIKVEQPASDYILNGKTEKIVAGGKQWDVVSGPATQNYLTLTYYYFDLKEIR